MLELCAFILDCFWELEDIWRNSEELEVAA